MMKMRLLLSSGLVATGLVGCADPCSDDGLLQDDVGECPAVSGGGESETATDGETETETETASDSNSESDTLDTDSDGGASCEDGEQNGDETDVDCGGSCSEKCDDGEGCLVDDDCMSNDCGEDDTCQGGDTDTDSGGDPTCDDGVQNGDEEGIDCGGSCPDSCEPVEYCEDVDMDGFGDPDTCVDVPPNEDPPKGTVPNNGDCADDNANAYPGAAEMEPELCAEDEDDDGYGDANPPEGVDAGSDCVDTVANIYPGAAELEPDLCTADDDDDGYGSDSATDIDPGADNGTDCADDNANAFPGSAPIDSPTACMEDEDNDDYGDADPPEGVEPGSDCNDMDDSVPFVVEGIPDDCATAELLDGSLGCEFYGIPLANLDASTYDILLANANSSLTATVDIERFIGGVWTTVAGPITLLPLEQSSENLPEIFSSSSGVSPGGSYRITSDIPIAAYQASVSQFTSDASLLIPRASWDLSYDVVGYDGLNFFAEEYIAVAAAEDGTVITVTPSQNTNPGPGVPPGIAGAPFEITLDEGETAVVMAPGQGQGIAQSMSGTTVTASAPVGLFTGTECSNIPSGVTYCDHLEEMLTPTNTAATTVVASRMPPRDQDVEQVIWQIYSIEDATVSFDALGGVTGLPAAPVDLLAGESLELSVSGTVAEPGDFVVESTAPIIVAQYLVGDTEVTNPIPGTGTGVPAQVVMPGASELLEAYVVGTVEGNVINHLTVTRQIGSSQIILDGAAIDDVDFDAINADWEVARIEIVEGTHSLLSEDPFSVVVSGYNSFNSYAYLGGGQARALVCE